MWITWCPRKPTDFKFVEQCLQESILRNHFTNSGPLQKSFAALVKSKLQIPNGYSVHTSSSGSSALHCLASAYAIEKGRNLRWVTQAFTFPSSAQGPMQNALILDNCATNYGPDVFRGELPQDIDGIVITNCFGCEVNIQAYQKFCRDRNLLLICDNANSPQLSKFACDGAIISLHETKPLGRGEGGLIVCPDQLTPYVIQASNFGYNRTLRTWNRRASNYRMSDLAAAFHMAHWSQFDHIMEKHAALTQVVLREMQTRPALRIPFNFSPDRSVLSILPILFPFEVDDLSRCLDNGIEAKKYYVPLQNDTQVADDWFKRMVCFPLHVDMEAAHLVLIFEVVDQYLEQHAVANITTTV